MALHDPVLRVILDEGEGTRPLSGAERFAAMQALLERGYPVSRSKAPRPPAAQDPAASASVVWVGAYLDSTTPSPATPRIRLENPADPGFVQATDSARAERGAPSPGAWLPWFPVIDYDRCTNCMQCLSFCLFGVYGVDPAGRIQAQQQDNCKTNCPACSRVCPEAAIMFPKYKAGPINGDNVSDSDLQREKMKIDISALLGGDVYSLLRDRSERARSRFGKERDADKALSERQKCLTKLGEIVADLPPEVLASLPSPDQIARKAEEARARVAAATANRGS